MKTSVVFCLFLLLTPAITHAGTVFQTDWSGGNGIPGPVTDLEDTFDTESEMNWSGISGELTLGKVLLTPSVKHTVGTEFMNVVSAYAADVNGDVISWWENTDGIGTSWTEHVIDDDAWHPRSVYAVDIDSDDNMDVVGSSFFYHDVSWYDIVEYSSEGTIESSIFDTQEYPDWQTIDWTGSSPAGTNIVFQVRASDDFSSMGAWSADITAPGSVSSILNEGASFFQYRTVFTSSSSVLTPVLEDVTVTWNPTSIGEESGQEVGTTYEVGVLTNPSASTATLTFSLPFTSFVELTVYDLTGRMAYFVSGDYLSGTHEVYLDDLTSGVYLVRMTSGAFVSTKQFAIIE